MELQKKARKDALTFIARHEERVARIQRQIALLNKMNARKAPCGKKIVLPPGVNGKTVLDRCQASQNVGSHIEKIREKTGLDPIPRHRGIIYQETPEGIKGIPTTEMEKVSYRLPKSIINIDGNLIVSVPFVFMMKFLPNSFLDLSTKDQKELLPQLKRAAAPGVLEAYALTKRGL